MYHVTNNPDDMQLFSLPRSLRPRSRSRRCAFRLVTDRKHEYRLCSGLFVARPRVGRTVANRYWDVMHDGVRMEVVEYHRWVIDRSGNEIGIVVTFDLQLLNNAARGQAP